jgi:predicted 2-oxoglutarate/Fe(II)-dependent dioxygenase YbiX
MHIESKIGDQGLYIVDCVDKEYLDQLSQMHHNMHKIDQLNFYRTSFDANVDSPLVKHLKERLRTAITEYLSMANLNPSDFIVSSNYKMSIWKLNLKLNPHRDTINYDEEHTGDPRSTVNALLYVTDGYTGGNINFPEFDLSIAPKAGSMVVFDSGTLHGVDEVISGERITLESNLYSIHKEDIDRVKEHPWRYL